MKRLSLTVIIALAAIVAAQAQTSKPPAGCHALGVTTYTFYGDRATVAKAIDRMPREMSRVVTVLIESNEAAEFRLFERQEGRTAVYSWSGTGVGNLKEDLSAVMLATRGKACAGEETKRILSQRYALETATAAVPSSIQAVVAPVVAGYSSGYLRVTVMVHCT
jgi:hypothetical protein